MKTLYLECGMGAAGDMMMAALYELLPDKKAFLDAMKEAGIPGVEIEPENTEKCGITGTHMKVTVHGEEEESFDEHVHHHDDDHAHHDEHDHGHEDDRGHHEEDDFDHGKEHKHKKHKKHDKHHHKKDRDHEHHDDEDDHEHDDPSDHDDDHPHDHGHPHDHDHHGHHHHASAGSIEAIIDSLKLADSVKEHAKAVYGLIAEAESKVHGRPVTEVHFHEVGAMDAVADVVGVCLLMEMIGADQIMASPVHVGSGQVRCMHGVVPVPAPATAEILKGIPTYGGKIQGELCTPTGAALLRHFAEDFGDAPVMAADAIGYGMGKKDFPRANCLRAFLGETQGKREPVTKLECNLDDMTGEALGFAMDQLFKAGAREVFTQPVGMKKSRSGVLLTVLSGSEDADRLAELILKHTTTIGVRRMDMTRYTMERSIEKVETSFGPVRIKKSQGFGVTREKLEYDDLAAIAERENLSLEDVRKSIERKD